eukprot:SAG31_NODE_212_length_20157_cov_9.648868_22_plen_168_part_00
MLQGDKDMVANIWAIHEMAKAYRRDEGDRLLFAMHAVRLLCKAQKDRTSDEAAAWMKGLDVQGRWGEIKPTVPDYAYDKHTRQGQAMVTPPFGCHAFKSARQLISSTICMCGRRDVATDISSRRRLSSSPSLRTAIARQLVRLHWFPVPGAVYIVFLCPALDTRKTI